MASDVLLYWRGGLGSSGFGGTRSVMKMEERL